MSIIFCILFVTSLIACGGLEVGLDEGTQDTLECISSDTCNEDDEDDEDGDTAESDDDDDDTNDDEETTVSNFSGTNETDSDSNGGIKVQTPSGYNSTSETQLLGTYQFDDFYTGYVDSDGNTRSRCDYNFPATIRGFSHVDDYFIDFETSGGDLVWVAELFEDDTFDFNIQFVDEFGHESIDLNCTCYIEDANQQDYYYDEGINCTCSSTKDGTCMALFKKI